MIKALAGDFVPFAVNVEAGAASGALRDHLPLCEQLGSMFAGLAEGLPATIDLELQGEIGDRILAGQALVPQGLLGNIGGDPVSYVNAARLAEQRSLDVRVITTPGEKGRSNLIRVTGDVHSLAGSLSPIDGNPDSTRSTAIGSTFAPLTTC